ncbi:MAG TPA: hypothetical protein VFG68_09980 [Fimbriiglobus sp.]|nr:hypothetical protein [Fimbriiglobus sp.]
MTTVVLALMLLPTHPSQDAVRLRARAALALAFADAKPPTYPEQYARALKEGKPLVVWVGQQVRKVDGCVTVGCDSFPGVGSLAVVVGLPTGDGKLARVDLPGKPTDAAVRIALRATTPPAAPVIPPR